MVMEQPHAPSGEPWNLRALGSLLWRRKWVIVIPTVACTILGYVISMPQILKPVYRCRAVLMFEYPQSLSGELAKFLPTTSTREQLQRLQNQIHGEEFLRKVIVATGMDKDPAVREWARKNRSRYPDLTEDELVDLRLMRLLRNAIRMQSPRSNVFEIIVEDAIPERARLIASTLTRAVVEANESAQMDLLRATHEFSLEQLALYKRKLDEAERRLQEARRRQARRQAEPLLVDAGNRTQAWGLLEEAKGEREQLAARWSREADSLASSRPRLYAILQGLAEARWFRDAISSLQATERSYVQLVLRPDGSRDPQNLAIQQARALEDLRREAMATLETNYPDLPETDRRELARLLHLKARLELAGYRRDVIQQALDAYQQRVSQQPAEELEIRRLEQEVETNRALYDAFVQQIAAAEISEALESTRAGGKITVLEPPQRPLKPVRPNRKALVLLSFLVGLAAGTGAAYFLERQDPSLRDIRQVESSTGLRVLGTLPAMKELAQVFRRSRNGVPRQQELDRLRRLFQEDNAAYHECRKIYLDLVRDRPGPVRTVLVTSAKAGEGKTTAAAFLAATVAREAPRARVLLVDLDSRRPSLHRYFGYDPDAPGVRDVIRSGVDPGGLLVPGWLDNLFILPIGRSQPDAPVGLTAEALQDLLARLQGLADFIVLDSPPNLPIPDALVAGQLVDAVLLVVKAGETPRRLVERGVQLQRQFSNNVRGIVLNNVSEALPYYDDYRYYGYGRRA
jgi:capsular exopolysaccharide synthesis family protein